MAPPVLEDRGPNIVFSVFKYFREYQYTARNITGTLQQHFSGLQIRAGYPDDLTKIVAPTLAIVGASDIEQVMEFFGEDVTEEEYSLAIFGFVLGQGSDAGNRVYRDRLYNDVYQLMSGPAGSEGIDLYDHTTKVLIGSIDVERPRGRLIPVNAIEEEVDRYKFVVSMGVCYV